VALFAFGMVTGAMPRPFGWKVRVVACFALGLLTAFTMLTFRLEESIGFLCNLFLHRAVPLLLGFTSMHYDYLLRASKRHTDDLNQAARAAATGSCMAPLCMVPHEDQDDDARSSSSSYIARDGSHERLA